MQRLWFKLQGGPWYELGIVAGDRETRLQAHEFRRHYEVRANNSSGDTILNSRFRGHNTKLSPLPFGEAVSSHLSQNAGGGSTPAVTRGLSASLPHPRPLPDGEGGNE